MNQFLGRKDNRKSQNDSEEMERIQAHKALEKAVKKIQTWEALKKKIEALEAQREKIFLTDAEEQQLFIHTTQALVDSKICIQEVVQALKNSGTSMEAVEEYRIKSLRQKQEGGTGTGAEMVGETATSAAVAPDGWESERRGRT